MTTSAMKTYVATPADRQRDSTGVFFRKGEAALEPANPANARKVSDAILRHYNGAKPLSAKVGKLLKKLSARIGEQKHVATLKDHRSAGEFFAGRLRKRVGA